MTAVINKVVDALQVATPPPRGGLDLQDLGKHDQEEYSVLSNNRRSMIVETEASSTRRNLREMENRSVEIQAQCSCYCVCVHVVYVCVCMWCINVCVCMWYICVCACGA